MRGRLAGVLRLLAGSGISLSPSWGGGEVTVTNSQPGHVIQDEGVALPQRSKLDFVGAGVTVTDDAANDKTVVNVSGGGGGGGGGWDPLAEWRYIHEFHAQGEWSLVSGSLIASDGEPEHPGIRLLTSPASTNNAGHIRLGASGQGEIKFSEFIDITFIIRARESTAVGYSVGVTAQGVYPGGSNVPGFWVRRDTAAGDVNWQCFTCNTSQFQTNSNVNFSTNTWYKIRMVLTPATSVEFYFNDVLVATHTTQVPDTTRGGHPYFYVITRESVGKGGWIDLVFLKVTGISR